MNAPLPSQCDHPDVAPLAVLGDQHMVGGRLVAAPGGERWHGAAVQVELGSCRACGSTVSRVIVDDVHWAGSPYSSGWQWLAPHGVDELGDRVEAAVRWDDVVAPSGER